MPDSFPYFNGMANNVDNPFYISGDDTFSFIIPGRILDLHKVQKYKSNKMITRTGERLNPYFEGKCAFEGNLYDITYIMRPNVKGKLLPLNQHFRNPSVLCFLNCS